MSYFEYMDDGGSSKSRVVNASQQCTRQAAVSAAAGHYKSTVEHRTSTPLEVLKSAKKLVPGIRYRS